ncbi:uncharacterized protein BCR38DRAFT_326985, partial [Pseudomassariella vexata]
EGVDIVFVHGLNGHRIYNWTKQGVCWPRDLLAQDVPNARIITWGYASPVADTNAFADLAERLLGDIARARIGTSRPIIFVGHGIGGLIIKEALVTAAMSRVFGSHNELGNVYPRTVGVLFLGTPHTNSGKQSLGDVVATAAQLSFRPPSLQLVRVLRDSTDVFESQRDSFILVSRDIQIVCVRELLKTPMGTMIPRESAIYQGFKVQLDEIQADHINMAKFDSRTDIGYQKLVNHINRLAKGASPQELKARAVRNQAEILDALYYDSMGEREERIDCVSGETCSWILSAKADGETASSFQSWLRSSSSSIFWISGKAGSGKSTLMKYAFHSEETKRLLKEWAGNSDVVMTSMFLFEAGSQIQKSREGILRSALYQIFSTRPDLMSIAFPSFFGCAWPPPTPFNTVMNLTQAFYSLFAHTSETLKICFFVDGLDEYRMMDRRDYYTEKDFALVYDEEEGDAGLGSSQWITDAHADIARLITDMGATDKVKVCVTSRELKVFEEAFAGYPRLRVHELSGKAVARYCAYRLEKEAPGLSDVMTDLCEQLAVRSGGDVLWARLAVNMLLEGSLRTLVARLDALPSRLGGADGLYMSMIENLKPEYQRHAYNIFQLVLRAHQPPHLVTLALAEQGYLDPATGQLRVLQDEPQGHNAEGLAKMCSYMKHRFAQCCAGLLEAESSPLEISQRVIFMHQTAKEFAARKDVWDKIPGNPRPNPVEVDFCLLSGCVRHLKSIETVRPICILPSVGFNPETWLLIANAVRYAGRIDGEGPINKVAYCDLLDELDRATQQAWVVSLQRHQPLFDDAEWSDLRCPALCRQHWTGYEPMASGRPPKRNNFSSLAVQANLVTYVSSRLANIEPASARRDKAQELLGYATGPTAEGMSACVSLSGDYADFHSDMPDPRILDVLFQHGADATQGSVWVDALRAGKLFFTRQSVAVSYLMQSSTNSGLMQNRQRWVAAVKAMLVHGADAHALVESAGEESRMKPALEFVRETLEGEPEYAVELAELEVLM